MGNPVSITYIRNRFGKYNMDTKRFGGCLCGAVRYEARGEPFAINYCHCADCRRHNGAPVVALVGYKADQVTFTGTTRKRYESSPGAHRAFCENCGTTLTWEGDGGELGAIFEIHISTFDEPGQLVPTSHAFEPEKLPWFEIADALPRFEGFSDASPLLHYGPSATK